MLVLQLLLLAAEKHLQQLKLLAFLAVLLQVMTAVSVPHLHIHCDGAVKNLEPAALLAMLGAIVLLKMPCRTANLHIGLAPKCAEGREGETHTQNLYT